MTPAEQPPWKHHGRLRAAWHALLGHGVVFNVAIAIDGEGDIGRFDTPLYLDFCPVGDTTVSKHTPDGPWSFNPEGNVI